MINDTDNLPQKNYSRKVGIVGITISSILLVITLILNIVASPLGGGFDWGSLIIWIIVLAISIFLVYKKPSQKSHNTRKALIIGITLFFVVITCLIIGAVLYSYLGWTF